MTNSVLLLSGGLDSIALAYWLRPSRCLFVNYGQLPASAEHAAAGQICNSLNIPLEELTLPLENLGAGDMSGNSSSEHSPHSEFWPFRNQILITLGAMMALRYELDSVLIGTVSTDSKHKDGTVDFRDACNKLLGIQEGSVSVEAPAASMTTEQLIHESGVPVSLMGWAHSCHTSNVACGECPGCYKQSELMGSMGINR
ncbi:7-cyano-7-deazaguanine synthase [Idiomarina tyrosinivorans]|uniref:7-cyano-7-deazaguanine synthase n=1 Tax=Idiomarina tyrosinivorans TaxID=1445662 RepID=A0A432ZSR4_9GAMM|nr:7-cyano-7-deazaguanine synthase [Idiomarina tyrosinivorans]RUO80950.1 7-cyano-7-deazaguanine synthase [Idiomarina tyrosinivorans]